MITFMRSAIYFLLMSASLFFSPQIFASEQISQFRSEIVIKTDGSAEITETITTDAEQEQIRHGIYRLLLGQFQNSLGKSSAYATNSSIFGKIRIRLPTIPPSKMVILSFILAIKIFCYHPAPTLTPCTIKSRLLFLF